MFTKNRDRLLDGAIADKFFAGVLARPELAALLSSEHFSVDGTLIGPGRHAASHIASWRWNSPGSSSASRKKVREVRPWRTPLSAARALPASVTGPMDRAPFRREAAD